MDAKYVIAETVSGSTTAMERKGLGRLMGRLEGGDVLIVTKMDRLVRNAMGVRATVERLAPEGVRGYCLALGGVDSTSAAGKLTMGVIATGPSSSATCWLSARRPGCPAQRPKGRR